MVESRQNKQGKPQDNVITAEESPSPLFGISFGVIFLAINFLVAAIYFGVINP
jgi:hypothetical protein